MDDDAQTELLNILLENFDYDVDHAVVGDMALDSATYAAVGDMALGSAANAAVGDMAFVNTALGQMRSARLAGEMTPAEMFQSMETFGKHFLTVAAGMSQVVNVFQTAIVTVTQQVAIEAEKAAIQVGRVNDIEKRLLAVEESSKRRLDSPSSRRTRAKILRTSDTDRIVAMLVRYGWDWENGVRCGCHLVFDGVDCLALSIKAMQWLVTEPGKRITMQTIKDAFPMALSCPGKMLIDVAKRMSEHLQISPHSREWLIVKFSDFQSCFVVGTDLEALSVPRASPRCAGQAWGKTYSIEGELKDFLKTVSSMVSL